MFRFRLCNMFGEDYNLDSNINILSIIVFLPADIRLQYVQCAFMGIRSPDITIALYKALKVR
jgi:hypothetical protein